MAYEILLLEIINNNIVVNNHKDILEIANVKIGCRVCIQKKILE